jgi:uncharacterized protein (TIGR03435 family)
MKSTMIASVLVTLAGAAASAQQPAFEVASIRASQTGQGSRRENIQAGADTVTMRNVTLKAAIRWAYHVFNFQVSGPEWMGFERFDIVAKSAGPVPEDQLRLMAQTLLADRFQLKLHRVTKEMAAYVLSVGKNGIKFKESATDGEFNVQPDQRRMTLTVQRIQGTQFVEMLSGVLRAPVIDQTGLKGKYDITIDGAKYMDQLSKHSESGVAPDPMGPAALVIIAIEDELGLKVESRKAPVDLLIVDHAEKVPTEN